MNPGMPFMYPPMGWQAPPPPPPAPAEDKPNPLITALEAKLAALTTSTDCATAIAQLHLVPLLLRMLPAVIMEHTDKSRTALALSL